MIYALTLTYYSPLKMVSKSMDLTELWNAHVYGCPDVMTHISISLLRNTTMYNIGMLLAFESHSNYYVQASVEGLSRCI